MSNPYLSMKLPDNTSDSKPALLKLRFLVGYLGEKANFAWWQTSFFSPTSSHFLTPAFPRTNLLAQYHGVVEAARRTHDEYIGVGQVFHLFRLPAEIEQDLHEALLRSSVNRRDKEQECSDKGLALRELLRLAENSSRKAVPEGPVAIGKVSEILQTFSIHNLAATYAGAFDGSVRTYPYFLSES